MHWYYIYIAILFVGLLSGIIRFRLLSISNRYCLLLILVTIISEISAQQISATGNSNLFVYHIFAPIRSSVVFFAFYKETKKVLLKYMIPFMIFISLIMSLWIQPLPAFNSYYIELELLLFTILSIYYFRKLLTLRTESKLKDYPFFWISCGMLIFCVSNIFDLGTHNFFIRSNTLLDHILLYIRYFTNYIYYSSFIVAFLVKQNTISDQYGK